MIRIIIFLTLLFNIQTAYAEKNIVIIDIQKVLQNSVAAKQAAEDLKVKLSAFQADIDKESAKLEKSQKSLLEQSNILSQEALQEKQRELLNDVRLLEGDVARKKDALDKAYISVIGEIEKTIKEIIKELSDKNQYNLVLSKDTVIYYTELPEISENVTRILNKRLPKVEIKLSYADK